MLTKKCYCKASIHVHSHKVFDLKSECIYINTLGLQEAVWLETIGCGNTPTVQWFPVEKHAYNFLNSTY